MTIDESTVRRFDITDPDLSILIGPDLGMLSRKDFRIKKAVDRGGNCFRICLATNSQNFGIEGHIYLLLFEGSIHGCQRKNSRWISGLPIGLPDTILL